MHMHMHMHMCMCTSPSRECRDTHVQRCVWLLTATGVGDHPAAIGAVEDATKPHRCQILMILAQVDNGELMCLLVERYRG